MELTRQMLASMIDHTVLKPTEGKKKIVELCEEAMLFDFFAVCVNPGNTRLCADVLKGSKVTLCVVNGFPLGMNSTAVKVFEAARAVDEGAAEVDMVLNVAAHRDKNYEYVENDVREVVKACQGRLVKVILETCYLDDAQKKLGCQLSEEAGADFVKTSTGFGSKGATVEDIRLMRAAVSKRVGVKASGGIRDWALAGALIAAGANRLGCSNPAAILDGMPK